MLLNFSFPELFQDNTLWPNPVFTGSSASADCCKTIPVIVVSPAEHEVLCFWSTSRKAGAFLHPMEQYEDDNRKGVLSVEAGEVEWGSIGEGCAYWVQERVHLASTSLGTSPSHGGLFWVCLRLHVFRTIPFLCPRNQYLKSPLLFSLKKIVVHFNFF